MWPCLATSLIMLMPRACARGQDVGCAPLPSAFLLNISYPPQILGGVPGLTRLQSPRATGACCTTGTDWASITAAAQQLRTLRSARRSSMCVTCMCPETWCWRNGEGQVPLRSGDPSVQPFYRSSRIISVSPGSTSLQRKLPNMVSYIQICSEGGFLQTQYGGRF